MKTSNNVPANGKPHAAAQERKALSEWIVQVVKKLEKPKPEAPDLPPCLDGHQVRRLIP